MRILGIIVGITLATILIRVLLLGKYESHNNELIRNMKKFDINRKNKTNE